MDICWGFDFTDPGNQGWTINGSAAGRSNSTFRTGTHAIQSSGSSIDGPNVGNLSSFYVGFAFRVIAVTGGREVVRIYDGSTEQITVTCESDGALKVRRGGAGGTVLATSATGLFTANVWHHIQLGVVFHASSGSVELRLNSVTVATASNVNTVASGNAYGNSVRMRGPDGFPSTFLDDVWISDSGFKGECVVETLYPSADGATNNFTASAGNRYQCVDETGDQNGDTDYVFSSTVNDIQLFAMGNLASTTGTVPVVRVHHTTKKDDAGGRSVGRVVRSGGSNSVGTGAALTTSYVVYSETLTQDPTDSAAWTIAKVNALEVGVKITA